MFPSIQHPVVEDEDEDRDGDDHQQLSSINQQPTSYSNISAAILLNAGQAGQARRRLGDLSGASRYYQKALKVLAPSRNGCLLEDSTHPSSTTTTTTTSTTSTERIWTRTTNPIILSILHNIGQLFYRSGNLSLAASAYRFAVEHAQHLHGPNDVSVSHAWNALGVTYYHSSLANESKQDYHSSRKTIGWPHPPRYHCYPTQYWRASPSTKRLRTGNRQSNFMQRQWKFKRSTTGKTAPKSPGPFMRSA